MLCKVHARWFTAIFLFGLAGWSSLGATPAASQATASTSQQPASSTKPAKKSTATAKPIVVPAGTTITVTIDQAISSKTNKAGDHFDASVATSVVVGGKRAIPAGAKASGTVTQAQSAGKLQGNAILGVAIDSVVVKGRTYKIKTEVVEEAGKGRGKRTAVGAGGGAVAGAIIGAIAGGGKGAAVGAAAGAGAGTAGAAFTGERDITLAAETKLNFKLMEPVSIRTK